MNCRCAECGLLAIRNIEDRQLVEVEPGMLAKWEIPPCFRNREKQQYEEVPLCFAMAANLYDEVGSFTREKVVEIITRARDCGSFIPRQRGFTPKDHREMQLAHVIQRQQQEQRERDREWEMRQERESRDRQDQRDKEMRVWQEKQNYKNRRLQGLLAVFAAIVAVGGVLLGKHLSTPPIPIIQVVAPESKK